MLKVAEIGMTGTMFNIFNEIGKASGLTGEELRSWSIEKSGKSRPFKEISFDLTIMGNESNKLLEPDRAEIFWIYVSSVDNEGKEEWVLKTFHNISSAHDYYIEVSKRDDLTELMIFLNGKLLKPDASGVLIFELEFNGISNYFRTMKDLNIVLFKFHELNVKDIEKSIKTIIHLW